MLKTLFVLMSCFIFSSTSFAQDSTADSYESADSDLDSRDDSTDDYGQCESETDSLLREIQMLNEELDAAQLRFDDSHEHPNQTTVTVPKGLLHFIFPEEPERTEEGAKCAKFCSGCGKCLMWEPFEIHTKNAAISIIG
jgi:hypothetical protein